jgi:hypothetical protein
MSEPRLEALLRRLADCPPEFLLELPGPEAAQVVPAAVVEDVLRSFGGGALAPAEAAAFTPSGKAGRRRCLLAMVGAWLLGGEAFAGRPGLGEKAKDFFLELARGPLSEIQEPRAFVTEADRREELARLALSALGLRPFGETASQAEDRLAALDSVETRRTAQQARAAQERARAVMEAMKKKAAEEAAAKVSRE